MPKTFDVELDEDQLLAQEQHLEQGGLFVPAGKETPEALSDVKVRLKTPRGEAEVDAQVVQVIPGGGVGLVVDRKHADERIKPLIHRAKKPSDVIDASVINNLALQVQRMTTEEKREMAKHGDRNARMVMMKDTNKAMHLLVLQNEALTLDEIVHMASLRNINPAVLQKIGQNRTWMRDKRLVVNMVSNPKTPYQTAKVALQKLGFMELRKLVKMGDVPPRVLFDIRQRIRKLG